MISVPLFLDGLGPAPMEQTRANSDVMTRALTLAGAERVRRRICAPLQTLVKVLRCFMVAILKFGLCGSARCVLITMNSAWERAWGQRREGNLPGIP